MSLRRVRCPRCARRFDVTGVAAGTPLRCGGCAVILKVPASPQSVSLTSLLRVAGGVAAGFVTVAVLWMVARPAPQAAPTAALHQTGNDLAAKTPVGPSPDLGIIDDPVAARMHLVREEFSGRRFTFSDRTRPYLIALESSDRSVDAERMKEFANEMEIAHAFFRRDLADRIGLPSVKDTLLPVIVLRSRESFDRHYEKREGKRQPALVKGIYEQRARRIVTYQDGVIPRDVILHEGAHQLVHYHVLRQTEDRKVSLSFWLQEGLATYFEGLRRRVDGEIGTDRAADHPRFALLKHVVGRKGRPEYVPLSQLLALTVDGYWEFVERAAAEDPAEADRKSQIYYAESWALVHFLRQSGARPRKVFEAFLRREIAGGGSRIAFEDLVRNELGIDLPELESQFLKYVQTLQ